MVSATVTVNNKTGLHARPASRLVKLCAGFESELCIRSGEKTIDPKSIIDLLSNGVKQGTTIEITAEGPDEQRAIDEIIALIESLDE
jgi:phosphotransferase system HPr (HPr) family protein